MSFSFTLTARAAALHPITRVRSRGRKRWSVRLGIKIGLLALAALADAAAPASPLTPPEELASFQFADPQLTIECVAHEPEVVSPVAIAWDADGRLFIAEMSDYPNSPEKGRIKLLEDRDGDGQYERATIFAGELPFPNGVLPWKGGLLVTAAPDIWFLTDTNGDGIADVRRKILRGFGEGNQQLRVNGLTWGLDNWIYGANGRSEGEVSWADADGASAHVPPVSIRGHDFRFRVQTRTFEAIAGRSQFGLARDDWGNRFLSWNTIPIRHEVLPERFLSRNPFLAATESLQDLLDPGDNNRVYPLTPPPLTFNNESTSHFNALAGLTVFRGEALGEKYHGNAFMGESLRNLVHRRVLEPAGPTFVARRGEQGQEFLASTDPWFHPVNFASGPDGALYVVDFYRRFVEHPDFVHTKAKDEVPWRTGAEHGRIWRIRLKTFKSPEAGTRFELSKASAEELVNQLESSNGWRRDTAQRLLAEREDRNAAPLLAGKTRTSTNAVARLQALYLLEYLHALNSELIQIGVRDPDARVRAQAIPLASAWLTNQAAAALVKNDLRNRLFAMERDPDARVRFQLSLALGDFDGGEPRKILARLAQRDFTNRWHALAVLSSLGKSPGSFLQTLVQTEAGWLRAPTEDQGQFLDRVAQLVGANHHDNELKRCLALIESAQSSRTAQFGLLAGLMEGLERSGQPLRQSGSPRPRRGEGQGEGALPSPDRATGQKLLARSLPAARTSALDPQSSLFTRLAALRVLVQARSELLPAALFDLLDPGQPAEVQSAAARGYGDAGDAALAKRLFSQWSRQTIRTRRLLLAASLRSAPSRNALLDALEEGAVSWMELDPSTRQALQKIEQADLKARIGKLVPNLMTDRDAVVRSFQPSLEMRGDRQRGAAIFARICLNCHAVEGRGAAIGPDLAGISARPSEAVLVDILDPSREVSPDFISYTVTTARGDSMSGLIANDTGSSVTLRRPAQPDETILRAQITRIRADGKSLMPDGLEQGLTQQDVADLLDFLRAPDGNLLPK